MAIYVRCPAKDLIGALTWTNRLSGGRTCDGAAGFALDSAPGLPIKCPLQANRTPGRGPLARRATAASAPKADPVEMDLVRGVLLGIHQLPVVVIVERAPIG